jgi:hypothetical protein
MRIDEVAVKVAAKRLICSHAQLWYNFTDELRDALVDMAVMDALRLADEDGLITPAKLLDFRARLILTLANGVCFGKARRRLTFERDREARRELLAHEAGTVGGNPLPRLVCGSRRR